MPISPKRLAEIYDDCRLMATACRVKEEPQINTLYSLQPRCLEDWKTHKCFFMCYTATGDISELMEKCN